MKIPWNELLLATLRRMRALSAPIIPLTVFGVYFLNYIAFRYINLVDFGPRPLGIHMHVVKRNKFMTGKS